jgi:hypothetical protein
MANTIIRASFAAGELSPKLGGRVDLDKDYIGCAVMRNFFVEFTGGASTRAGTASVSQCRITSSMKPPRLIPFIFNSNQAYELELNESRMRVIYRGGYILEAAFSITGFTTGFPGFFVVPGHNYSVGDVVYVQGVAGLSRPNGISGVNGRAFYVSNIIGSSVYVQSPVAGGYADFDSAPWSSYASGGTIARIYEVATPWAADDLFALNFAQSADVLTITHPNYPPTDILRYSDTNWQIVTETFGAALSPPSPSAAAVNNNVGNPQYFFAYVVTVIDGNGRESDASGAATVTNQALSQTATPNVVNRITYSAVSGAYKYRIYKAQPVPSGQQGSGPYFYGLVGQTYDTVFVDVNFAPDYTQAPPQVRNPFASNNPACVGYLDQRRVFAGSTAHPSTFWMSQPGQFTNYDVSDPTQDSDAITAAIYAQEVNVIGSLTSVTGGLMALTTGGAYLISGGPNNAAVTPTTIQAPAQAFSGAAPLMPLRIADHVLYAQARGSAVRDLAYNFYSNNFTGSDVSVLSAHLLEGRKIVQWCYAEEPHKIVWAVRDDGVLLSLTYLKEQQVAGWARHDTQGFVVSVSSIPEDTEDAVYMVVRRYTPTLGFLYHVERLASRQFGANPAANIPPQPELAWCVDGGVQYPMTYPSANITAASIDTLGTLYSVSVDAGGSGYVSPTCEVQDLTGTGATVSLTVVGGVITAATLLTRGQNYTAPVLVIRDVAGSPGNAAILTARVTNEMLISTDGSGFSAGDVGKIVRVRGGRGTVLSSPSPSQLYVDMDVLPAPMPNFDGFVLPPVNQGAWSMTAPVSVIGGLDHLNGSTVQILVDGNVNTPQVVQDGCVTLDQPGTCIIAGHGFTAQLQTMRIETQGSTIQGKRKVIPNLVVRAMDTRGLQVGSWWDRLTEIKDRTTAPMGEATPFQQGGGQLAPLYSGAPVGMLPFYYADNIINLETSWDDEGVLCVQQSYPLPATILALVPDILVGDNA